MALDNTAVTACLIGIQAYVYMCLTANVIEQMLGEKRKNYYYQTSSHPIVTCYFIGNRQHLFP